ncbi:MAG TPA: hypothetical protein VG100_00055 [Xanthobacteraceae bacterium]|jgi:hypothetical protein|nr:hypothetical protein [Xanthobacteraceae bacterium]
MHWQLQPIIWLVLIATLAILAIPHPAHPQEPSAAIRRACDGDVRRLCPKEYAARDGARIRDCMGEHKFSISLRCQAAWIKEHGLSK